MRLTWICLTAFAMGGSLACGSSVDGGGSDDEGEGGGGSGNVPNEPSVIETDCGSVDTSCPSVRPFVGSPCQGNLQCSYVEEGGFTTWQASCINGAWTASATCEEEPLGGTCGGVPPPAEACTAPFSGTLDASVEIGPATEDLFRAFYDGEPVAIEWGGQGSAMVFYRLKLAGPELPTCVGLTITLESPMFTEPLPQEATVVLRCGQSLSMYSVIPSGDCTSSEPMFEATLRVLVDGVGEVAQPVQLPTEALCGGFG